VLKEKEKRESAGLNPEPFLLKKSGLLFYNTSPLDMKKLMGDQDNIREKSVFVHSGVLACGPRHFRML
jgi:type I restriction enzyme M protein